MPAPVHLRGNHGPNPSQPAGEFEEGVLSEYLALLRRRKWSMLAVVVIVVSAVMAASYAQTPVYEGRATVILTSSVGETLFNPLTGAYNDPGRAIHTQIRVLKSLPVRQAVREKLGVAPKIEASAVNETDVIELRAEFGDPTMAAEITNAYANAYIEFRREKAIEELLAAGDQLNTRIAELQRTIDALGEQISNAPVTDRTAVASRIGPERDSLITQAASFKERSSQLSIDAALKTGGAQLVEPAVPIDEPVRPRPVRNGVMGLTVGIVLAVAVAFLRETLDDTIKSRGDLQHLVTSLPVMGPVPAIPAWRNRDDAQLISISDPTSPAAEAYRGLRTSIKFISLEHSVRVIQITSPTSGEGKTTTIANLAVAFAQSGQRVVVVDCDLRRPRVSRFFDISNEVGLTSVLTNELSLPAALRKIENIPALQILASGPLPPNPSEILTSRRMAQLIRALADACDIVLLDSPPVLPVADARVLAGMVDAVLLVARAGMTTTRTLSRSIESMREIDAPLAGVILNGVGTEYTYGYAYDHYYANPPDNGTNSRRESTRSHGRRAAR